ncbi:MAG: hypothetical protein QNJ63_31665, partial [Calothrix sp. MO_192.B10]|nr:hypothetical protein [Calothrix sp. MO_192.B10]
MYTNKYENTSLTPTLREAASRLHSFTPSLPIFKINSGGKPMPFGGKSIKLPTIGWVRLYEGLPDGTT